MINALHLLWMLPLAASIGFAVAAMLSAAKEPAPEPNEPHTLYGYRLDQLAKVAYMLESKLITPDTLNTFLGDNLQLAFRIVHEEQQRQLDRAMRRINSKETTLPDEQ